MRTLTVCFITARHEPEVFWFLESLAHQTARPIDVIVVDFFNRPLPAHYGPLSITVTAPKPCVWQGPHKLTKEDWWAIANARNTAICLCKTEWISFVDDRLVLMPTWLAAVQDAMAGGYAVCGPYQKRHSMTVQDGFIKNAGIITGDDNRKSYVKEHWSVPAHRLKNPYKCPGAWWYGCSNALPLQWALNVNGYDEYCDSSGGEDYLFGTLLENNGYELRYDLRMEVVEDRSADKLGPVMLRTDKGVSPDDKSHALLERIKKQKRSQHNLDVSQLRSMIRQGHAWPIPTQPTHDWFDGEALSEMAPR